jgi:very-short-patch-repair endonuclease
LFFHQGVPAIPVRNTVRGQRVEEDKVLRAKELRRQMTPAEKILWKQLRTNRLAKYHFRRQQVIAGFIVDFYCHAAALVVEVDGPVHEGQIEADTERDLALSGRGFRVLRAANDEVIGRLPEVLERIERACRGDT